MRDIILSNCCGAKMHYTFCTACGEHAAPEDEENPTCSDCKSPIGRDGCKCPSP